MEKNLLKYVLKHSMRDQITIVIISFATFPLVLAALYIPKIIVNEVLGEGQFPQTHLGFEFDRLDFLFTLCGILLTLVIVNNGLKYYLNVRKGLTGERMLRRMRFELFSRIVKRPIKALKSSRPVEMVQAIVAELEPIGAFIGEIVATPIYQGGHLLVYLGFILMQDPILGLAAIILFPVQAYVIPIVQKRVVAHVQERIKQVRWLSSELNDSLSSVEEMRLNGSTPFHLAQISSRLYTIFTIRYRIYILKFAVKFANNVINHLIPFFFYAIGGYLVLQGRMDLGALVAILAAYKDIASPWKELLRYYQTYSDITARYTSSIETYAEGPEAAALEPRKIGDQSLRVENVTTELAAQNGGLENVNFAIAPGSLTLFTGPDEIGRELVIRMLAGLEIPKSGAFHLGDQQLGASELISLSGEVSFVGRNPMMISETLQSNLTYGILADQATGNQPTDWNKRKTEARLTGTVPDDPKMNWTDYARAGVEGEDELRRELVEVLRTVGIDEVIFANGLAHRLEPDEELDGLQNELLSIRAQIAELDEAPGKALVEPFSRDSFMENATLFENLFFGCWDEPMTGRRAILQSADLRKAITKLGIADQLESFGLEAAEILAKLMGGLADSPALMKRIDLVSIEDLDHLEAVVSKSTARGSEALKKADRWFLIGLALDLRPIRHRLGVLDPAERRQFVVETRAKAPKLPGFTHFDHAGFIPGLSAIENILIGRPRLDRRDAKVSIEDVLFEYLGAGEARAAIMSAGLLERIVPGHNELSASDRRSVALARALLRRPKLLLIEAMPSPRVSQSTALLERLRARYPGMTIVAAVPEADGINGRDAVFRVDHGAVTPQDAA